jgi:hypothetical protein
MIKEPQSLGERGGRTCWVHRLGFLSEAEQDTEGDPPNLEPPNDLGKVD